MASRLHPLTHGKVAMGILVYVWNGRRQFNKIPRFNLLCLVVGNQIAMAKPRYKNNGSFRVSKKIFIFQSRSILYPSTLFSILKALLEFTFRYSI